MCVHERLLNQLFPIFSFHLTKPWLVRPFRCVFGGWSSIINENHAENVQLNILNVMFLHQITFEFLHSEFARGQFKCHGGGKLRNWPQREGPLVWQDQSLSFRHPARTAAPFWKIYSHSHESAQWGIWCMDIRRTEDGRGTDGHREETTGCLQDWLSRCEEGQTANVFSGFFLLTSTLYLSKMITLVALSFCSSSNYLTNMGNHCFSPFMTTAYERN